VKTKAAEHEHLEAERANSATLWPLWAHHRLGQKCTRAGGHEPRLSLRLDTSDEWIVQRSGIRERHMAGAHETTSSMSVEAGRKALARAGLTPGDLDLIIVATSTPDYHTPPVSSLVQAQLGATNVPAFVVVTGCTGFVYAYSVANQFIQTGAYKTILVIGAELLSRFVDWRDRSTCVLFGDAAGAVVIQATDEPCGMDSFTLGSDGSQGETIIMRSGGSKKPFGPQALADGDIFLEMNGREVFKFAARVVGKACADVLREARMPLEDIDMLIPHQANLRISQFVQKKLGLRDDQVWNNIQRFGNTTAAPVPIALCEAWEAGKIKDGDLVCLAAFGSGFTWASALMRW